MFVTASPDSRGPRWIINFPTKKHWRNPSKPQWVAEGLSALRSVIAEKQIRSIALPAPGCGNGGLDWSEVRPLIESSLGDLADVQIIVYESTPQHRNVSQ